VAEGSFWPKTWKEAWPLLVWGVLIFASGFEGIVTLVHWELIPSIASFTLMVGMTAMLIHREKLKSWLLALNPNWVVPAIIVTILIIGASPFLNAQRWPLLLIWQTIKPAPTEQATAVPTSMRILFGGKDDAPKGLEARNIKWQVFTYDYYSYAPIQLPMTMIAPYNTYPADKQCGIDGVPTGYTAVGPSFCQYKSKKISLLLSFERPVTFKKLKIESAAKPVTSWKQEAMTETYAVVAFDSYPVGLLLDIDATE